MLGFWLSLLYAVRNNAALYNKRIIHGVACWLIDVVDPITDEELWLDYTLGHITLTDTWTMKRKPFFEYFK